MTISSNLLNLTIILDKIIIRLITLSIEIIIQDNISKYKYYINLVLWQNI